MNFLTKNFYRASLFLASALFTITVLETRPSATALFAAKPINFAQFEQHFYMLNIGDTRALHADLRYVAENPKIVSVAGNSIQALANGETQVFSIDDAGKKTLAATVTIGWPVQNPVLPFSWNVYVPDTEAHNFGGKIYIYGSLDAHPGSFCSPFYISLFSSDLRRWESYGVSFSSFKLGPHKGRILWDSDGAFHNGKFLHYGFYEWDSSGKDNHMFVAESKNPTGPFSEFKWVVGDKTGTKIDGISAQVFTDDDGQRYITYAPTKQPVEKNYPVIAKLINNYTIDESSATNIGAPLKDFYEGPSLRKRGDTYYFVYAENTGKITRKNRRPLRLSYATSKNIFGPYVYRGIILTIEDIVGDGNIQGSIEQHNGEWFVFYHRTTNALYNRRALCVQKIQFDKNGLIKQEVPTSSGVAGALPSSATLYVGTAVIFKNIKRGEFGQFGGVTPLNNGSAKIGFRYVSLTGHEKKLTLNGTNLKNLKNLQVFADDKQIASGNGENGAILSIPGFAAKSATITLVFEKEKSGKPPIIYSARFE
ncbi:MAG: family 43 glycosylhydrolase [Puniceicoccales bacterium]|jgi:hypothetical protein|nr:family 43 glycosylhydrolase [Puniceicoccales bacterium]